MNWFTGAIDIIPLLLFLVGFLATVRTARILSIFPLGAKSHYQCNTAIMKSLHAAGHQITVISPFPSENTIENYTIIDSNFDTFIYIGQSSFEDFADKNLQFLLNIMTEMDDKYCYDIMKLKVIQDALNSTEKLYDVLFTELLSNFRCYLPIAEKLNIPVIGTVTLRSWKLADSAVGLPNNPAVIPMELIPSSPTMNFIQRVKNAWNYLTASYHENTRVARQVDKFYRQYFDESLHYKKQISLVFYNNHPTLLPRQTVPNVIEIGGVHIGPASPLPHDLKKFIDEAEHGVILLTFGSVIKASTMPAEIRDAFKEAFAEIPQRVIWKFEEPIDGLSKNVIISKWVPQRDILEHNNVKAFISHCGQGGVYEALYTATPIVSTPVFADQQSNAAILEHLEVGVHLDYRSANKENILQALNNIINDTRYYKNMQKLSHTFRDRPMSPQESVVFWTEYVIRHNGAPFLKSLESKVPLYQYLLLDILSLVLAVAVVGYWLVSYILKYLYTLLFKCLQGSNLAVNKNKKNL